MARWHTTDWDLLPEHAFQQRGWKGGMTLEGGKGGSSAPSPDPNIGIAQRELSALAKTQWDKFSTDIYPELLRQSKVQEDRANAQFEQDKKISDFNFDQSQKAYQRYEQGAIPAMEKLKADADNYNDEGYREQLAQQAKGDLEAQFANQRQQTSMRNQAYGIDPTSGVSQGMNNANDVAQAAIMANAVNQTRQAAKDVGLQKQANIYNMYAGLPAQGNANTALTLNANQSGLAAGQTAFGNYSSAGASLGSAAGTAMQGWNSVGQLGVSKYNADVSKYNAEQQASASSSAGLGSMVGALGSAAIKNPSGAASLAAMFSDIRVKENVVLVGVLPNGINVYEFDYKPEFKDIAGHGRYRGVMADEVEHVVPGAVLVGADGYKRVDYAKVVNHGV